MASRIADRAVLNSYTPAAAKVAGSREQRAWGQAQNFEQVFLNTMFGQMFTGIGTESPLGGKHSESWRGMLVDEYAKSVSAQGGVGLANHIYRELVNAQEAGARRLPVLPATPALPAATALPRS
ncbi:MAG: rod-binding protein [Proteobacteria bacterium]|nr:rod-binding protein [Pseudomonadota bacterium]